MNAKVMKEFVEGKSGLTAEYVFARVNPQQHTATLTFSSQPIFVSMSFYINDFTWTVNTAFTSTTRSCYFAGNTVNGCCNVSFSGNQVNLSHANSVDYVYAIGFF